MNLEQKFLQLTAKHAELQVEYTKTLELNESLTWKLNEQIQKNRTCKSEMEAMSLEIANGKSCIRELQRSKDVLATELEELTKNLFEEASGMVAKEAKRRNAIQIQQDALQKELEIGRDLIAAQQEELQKYRALLVSNNFSNTKRDTLLNEPPDYERICGTLDKYCQLYSLDNAHAIHPDLLRSLRDSVDPALFHLFVNFVEEPIQHIDRFMKKMFIWDVEGTLRGCHKILKVSERRIFQALVKGKCSLELCSEAWLNEQYFYYANEPSSPVSSATHSILNLYYSFVGGSNDDMPATKSPSPTTSVASDESSSETATEEPTEKIINFMCGMCGKGYTDNFIKHRFRLNSDELWLPLDMFCRERLVSVGNFVTFALNIRNGFYNLATDPFYLFLRFLQHRREMFYAKCAGSLFFRTNDALFFQE